MPKWDSFALHITPTRRTPLLRVLPVSFHQLALLVHATNHLPLQRRPIHLVLGLLARSARRDHPPELQTAVRFVYQLLDPRHHSFRSLPLIAVLLVHVGAEFRPNLLYRFDGLTLGLQR